ncbi:ABC transporter C-terminal domain-containing protein, partial [Micropruina sp.]|uniref:ABC transporter C-terminal domain-containing protein n=1 Tax=Micropruina sp. TaxID=2737536 RepID=UPI0026305CBD
ASGSAASGSAASGSVGEGGSTSSTNGADLSGAELRALQKELASVERRIAKLTDEIHAAQTALAEHDHTDYVGLAAKMTQIEAKQTQVGDLEERWLELSELVE